MKNTVKAIAIVMASFAAANSASAQSVSATADATGTIIRPLTITKATNMQFGDMAVLSGGGTVIMGASSAGTRTPSGDVSLPASSATVTAASFNVTGEGGYTYNITLPSSSLNLSDGASHTMALGSFTDNGSSHARTFSGTGSATDILYVGATLTVNGNQAPGQYALTSSGGGGAFSVTISY